MSGQPSADAVARSPIGMGDTAGAITAAEAASVAVAEAMNQRRIRLTGTTNGLTGTTNDSAGFG
jgi:hypothetical protein